MDGRFKFLALCFFGSIALSPLHEARGSGEIHLISSGFLKTATDRPNASTTLMVDPHFERAGKYVDARLDIQALAFLNDHSSFTVESDAAYVATSRALIPHHQVTLGRRFYDWSRADHLWQLGLWSPRFNWDPLLPREVGLTGAFYSYESRSWRLLAYASPISIPERGFPVRAENGNLISASAFWKAPLGRAPLLNRNVPIHYSIEVPPFDDLLLHPSAALSLRYETPELGPWASLSYGVLPVHQVDLALETQYAPIEDRIYATIHPRVIMRQLANGEIGFADRDSMLWGSVTVENPMPVATNPLWISNHVGHSVIAGVGGELFRSAPVSFQWSYLSIREEGGSTDQAEYALPPRFSYNHAVMVGARGELAAGRIRPSARLIRDLDWTENWIQTDLEYRANTWNAGIGADLISTETGRGYLGQYDGEDRIRGSISYAF